MKYIMVDRENEQTHGAHCVYLWNISYICRSGVKIGVNKFKKLFLNLKNFYYNVYGSFSSCTYTILYILEASLVLTTILRLFNILHRIHKRRAYVCFVT